MSGFIAHGGVRPLNQPSPGSEPGSVWRTLKHRMFFWLTLAALVSNIGTWMQNVGASWLMTSLSPSPLMVALIQTSASLPILLLALPAGALADIVDRRRLLLFSQGWMLIAAGVLGLLTTLHAITPWSLLGLSLALGIGSAMNAPAWQAIVPELVPREELTAAVSIGGINFNLARAVGPALGGIVVAWAGAGATFILNAASFLAVMAVLFEWDRPHTGNVLPAERVMGAIRAGIRYARHAPALDAVLVRTAAFIIGASALWAVLPILARFELGMGAAGYGALLAFFGAGAMAAGAALPRLGQQLSRHAISGLATVWFALALIGLALTRNLLVVSILMAMAGASWTVTMTVFNVATQLSVPAWVQGRALAVYQVVLQGGMAAGSVLWGWVAERQGVRMAIGCAAAAVVVGLLTVLRFRLAADSELDLGPSSRPVPKTLLEIHPDAGPVLVTIEYCIDPGRAHEFAAAMRLMRTIRLRDGAVFWGLFFDAAQPRRFIEHFVVESWAEHLRQHYRGVAADRAVESMVRAYHVGDAPPSVTHQLSAQGIEMFDNLTRTMEAAETALPPR
ncbi:MAG TPA: MFS transporter [Candidatus Binataceae bacterium]